MSMTRIFRKWTAIRIIVPVVLIWVAASADHLTAAAAKQKGIQKHPQKKTAQNQPDLAQINQKKFLNLFRRMFYSTAYNSLKCHENVHTLLLRAKADKLDLTDVRIIFLFDRDYDKLLPTKTVDGMTYGVQRPTITMYQTRRVYNRSDPPVTFRFHVFACLRDRIMDFDYTNRPRMAPARDYFQSMFAPPGIKTKERTLLFQRLTVRVIPGAEYLTKTLQHTSWYLFDLEKRYPSQSLNQFLLSLEKKYAEEKDSPSSD